jgi:hypothetical protein
LTKILRIRFDLFRSLCLSKNQESIRRTKAPTIMLCNTIIITSTSAFLNKTATRRRINSHQILIPEVPLLQLATLRPQIRKFIRGTKARTSIHFVQLRVNLSKMNSFPRHFHCLLLAWPVIVLIKTSINRIQDFTALVYRHTILSLLQVQASLLLPMVVPQYRTIKSIHFHERVMGQESSIFRMCDQQDLLTISN